VKLAAMFGRFERLIGRFNKWLAPAAIASGTVTGKGRSADPRNVTAILTELERGAARAEGAKDRPTPGT
jgi:hypothetical protein